MYNRHIESTESAIVNHLDNATYNDLLNELYERYSTLRHYLNARTPKDKLDSAGPKKYWQQPDNIRILLSTKEQRQRAIADLKVILTQISAIK